MFLYQHLFALWLLQTMLELNEWNVNNPLYGDDIHRQQEKGDQRETSTYIERRKWDSLEIA